MKKFLLLILSVSLCVLVNAQGTWTQKANFGGSSRGFGVAFSIGTKGYIATGREGFGYTDITKKDVWEWNQATNVWTQKADFGGSSRNDAVAFSIGSKGYIGTGGTGNAISGTWTQDFWEFDPTANTWLQKADFGGGLRTRAVGFSIGNKGYIGTGWSNSTYHNDIWEWDQSSNTWTQKANLPGTARWDAVGFSIGNKGFVGLGYYSGNLKDFWEFDPTANSWVQRSDFAGGDNTESVGFSIGSKGYVGTGWNSTTTFNYFWEWDPATNAWLQLASYSGGPRVEAVGFSIGSKGYIGTGGGIPSAGLVYNDFWEFSLGSSVCYSAPSGMVGWWTADGNSNDISGSANHGTLAGGASYVSGMVSQAFTFNGSTGYVNIPDANSLDLSQAISVEAWFKLNNVSTSAQTIVSKGVACDHNFLLLVGDGAAPDEFEFTVRRTAASCDGAGEALVTTNANLVANTWYHVVGVADGTNKYIYLNGQLLASNSGVAPYQTNNGNMEIGTANHGTAGFLNGIVDEVSLYSKALSVSEVQGIYNAGSSGKCKCTPPPFTLSQTNVSCGAGSTGSATVTVTGGASPFTYSWNTSPVQTTSAASGLSAGSYIVTITDAVGCSVTSNVIISQPTAITGSALAVNASCGNASDGSVTLNVSGGSPAFTYSWNNGASTKNISGLSPGVYSVVVSDAVGCSTLFIDTVGSANPNYALAFSANPQAGAPPLIPAFANNTPNLSNYNFTWYFGDGSSASNNNATVFHTYQFNGLYDITLVATSIATGCTDTLTKTGYIFVSGGAGCTHTASVTPAGPINGCQGDIVILSCNKDSSFSYQWNVNSIAISGATSYTLAAIQSGYYAVTITKQNCPVTSAAVQVNFTTSPTAPLISSAGTMVACVGGSVTLTASNIPGVTYLWSTSQTTQSIVVTSGGIYSVTVKNGAGCAATTSDTVSSGVPGQVICMVTVDSTSSKNIIVWPKPVTAAIDSFRIYREVASAYKHVGSVAYSALSTFTDNTGGVNPKITAYKYKISVLDSCGDESPLSAYHRTIHLAISAAIPCGYNLFWNDYVGFPVTQYRILRDSAGTGWKPIDSVSVGTTAWTDISCYPAQDTIAYRLEINHSGACIVSVKNPFEPMANLNLSRSNIQKNLQTVTSVIVVGEIPVISVQPNPNAGIFTVRSDARMSLVEVMNLVGDKIYSSHLNSSKTEIDMGSSAEGVYLLRVISASGSAVRKIIITR